ncbi:uncharacterized protein N7473_001672 [Penicillium subrubescens]|uniref:uncharacterized protein n=1 Tax=Penicillium subrubescens TaxID=1316194 RepID=UPI002544FEB2|nr:uncharacterized protein N7473_001672 [Penicillium subrubescens]KAJ5904756.1 hypothetical protein N7473_001672 [Penicillium subrubescens]
MTRASSSKRALMRIKCREALSAHICKLQSHHVSQFTANLFVDERLGLTIAPAQVQLQPFPSDGYSWSATGTSATLLEKNISSGNIWFYKSICQELGRSLEAVPVQVLKGTGKDKLEIAISRLNEELSYAREQLSQSQAENCRLDQALTRSGNELESSTFENSNLRNELLRSETSIIKAMQALEGTAVKTATESQEDLQMED